MTTPELLERIAAGEGPLCEFKPKVVDAGEIRKAVVAFANTVRSPDAGVLFLGLDANGSPTGLIPDADQAQRNVKVYLESCYPPIRGIRPHVLMIEDKAVVAIEVPESRNAPHFTGPAYTRIGSRSEQASPEMLDEMIADRTQAARILRPWVGDAILVYRQFLAGSGSGSSVWAKRPDRWLVKDVSAIGLIIQAIPCNPQSAPPEEIRAAWTRVQLEPFEQRVPTIRVSLP